MPKRAKPKGDGVFKTNKVGTKVLVQAPVARAHISRSNGPMFQTLEQGACRIRHREYVADIANGSSSNFNISYSAAINPGQVAMFTWLARLAQNYESYVFNSLSFDFQTNASSASVGSVMIFVDYDARDNAPSSKQYILDTRSFAKGQVWNSFQFNSLKSDLSKAKSWYVRPDAQPSGTDIHTYDIGNIYVATQGGSPGVNIGELYVEYDVTLKTPQVNTIGPLLSQGLLVQNGGTISPANPLGSTPAAITNQGYSIDGTSKVTVFSTGNYMFIFDCYGTTMSATNPSVTLFTGSGFAGSDAHVAQTSEAIAYGNIQVTANNSVFQLTLANASLATYTSCFFYLLPVISGVTLSPPAMTKMLEGKKVEEKKEEILSLPRILKRNIFG